MINPLNNYSGGGLRPVMDSAGELTDDVCLAMGYYPEGTVLGQVLGTGTDVNEVQTITPSGTISGGTFALVFDGLSTTPLAFNAPNATIQAALEALPNVGPGGIVVAGGLFNAIATTYTFSAQLGGKRQTPLGVNSLLTGGGGVTVTVTTPGKSAAGYWGGYNDAASGASAGLATAKRILQYATRVDGQGKHYGGSDLGADHNAFLRAVPAYIAGTFLTSQLVGLDANAVTDLGRIIAGDVASIAAPTTIIRLP